MMNAPVPRTMFSFLAPNGVCTKLYYVDDLVGTFAVGKGQYVFITPQDGTFLVQCNEPAYDETSVMHKVMAITETEFVDSSTKQKVPGWEVHLAPADFSTAIH